MFPSENLTFNPSQSTRGRQLSRRASQVLPLTQGEVAQSAGEGVVKTAVLYSVFWKNPDDFMCPASSRKRRRNNRFQIDLQTAAGFVFIVFSLDFFETQRTSDDPDIVNRAVEAAVRATSDTRR